jgi:mRNA interferase RelE/StbE
VSAYTLEFTPSSQKDLNRIPAKQADRILLAIRRLAEDPRPHGSKKLVGQESYRIRVGDYRVVYMISDKTVTVTIVRVRHRKDACD